ncbi:MAG: hypothetical protein F4Y91_15200 [Gemmatimonadetes bacterium]|nr:hypothetical protein [Gemmatimonadota bacterium]MYB67847.1 hypothetical protein [Gemmatimonadota bacterium]
MLAIITLFAMLMVETANADQVVNHTRNTQPPDAPLDYWTGRIEQDTTWRDTVYVSGDVTIASGATLTLALHTKVHFMPYRDDTQGNLDSTRAELIVEGRLHAQAGGIVFCSANAASLGADWYGIVVERGGLADVSNATIRDGLRCLYAKMGGRVTMDHVAFANCGKPTRVSLSQRSAASASDSKQVDALLVADGLRATPDSLVESRGFMSTGKRVALKLITGTIGGLMGVMIVAETLPCYWKDYHGDRPIFCDSLGPAFLYGYPAGIAIGVSQVAVKTVDPRVRSEMFLIKSLGVSLGGSAVGLIGGVLLTHVNDDVFWPSFFVGPIVGATWASEWWCPPPAARRISVGLMPNPRGSLSAVAALHF